MPCKCFSCAERNEAAEMTPSQCWESQFKHLRHQWSFHSKFGTVMNNNQNSCNPCRCSCSGKNNKLVKGRFGLAWIAETPNCPYCEPFGWQVQFTDTPSNVEAKCKEMVNWINSPPLPKGLENSNTIHRNSVDDDAENAPEQDLRLSCCPCTCKNQTNFNSWCSCSHKELRKSKYDPPADSQSESFISNCECRKKYTEKMCGCCSLEEDLNITNQPDLEKEFDQHRISDTLSDKRNHRGSADSRRSKVGRTTEQYTIENYEQEHYNELAGESRNSAEYRKSDQSNGPKDSPYKSDQYDEPHAVQQNEDYSDLHNSEETQNGSVISEKKCEVDSQSEVISTNCDEATDHENDEDNTPNITIDDLVPSEELVATTYRNHGSGISHASVTNKPATEKSAMLINKVQPTSGVFMVTEDCNCKKKVKALTNDIQRRYCHCERCNKDWCCETFSACSFLSQLPEKDRLKCGGRQVLKDSPIKTKRISIFPCSCETRMEYVRKINWLPAQLAELQARLNERKVALYCDRLVWRVCINCSTGSSFEYEVSSKSDPDPAVIPQFLVQSGDITEGNGTGGESIYGLRFDDENFTIKHNVEGIVGMANCGPNTNNSQFYITTVPSTHLDNLNVAFGKVRKGFNILTEICSIPTKDETPLEKCIIHDCGELRPGEPWQIEERDMTEDVYPPWPNDWDGAANEAELETVIKKIKDSGNYYYNRHNYVDSDRKYKKALRYIDWLLSSNQKCNVKSINILRLNSLLNLAAVRLKKDKYKDALEICNQVLNCSEKNGKALYRRALAKMGLKDYDGAVKDFQMALSIIPNDSNIRSKLDIVKRQKLSYLKLERAAFSRIFE